MAISAMSNTTSSPADEGTLDQCALVNFTKNSTTRPLYRHGTPVSVLLAPSLGRSIDALSQITEGVGGVACSGLSRKFELHAPITPSPVVCKPEPSQDCLPDLS